MFILISHFSGRSRCFYSGDMRFSDFCGRGGGESTKGRSLLFSRKFLRTFRRVYGAAARGMPNRPSISLP